MKKVNCLVMVCLAILILFGIYFEKLSIEEKDEYFINATSDKLMVDAKTSNYERVHKSTDEGNTEENGFKVYYHENDNAIAEEEITIIPFGISTKTLTISELGYNEIGRKFVGWRAYRSDIHSWRIVNDLGEQKWSSELLEGYNYFLYGNGTSLAKTAPAGEEVHLYAQWREAGFTVVYHEDDYTNATGYSTEVSFGVDTPTLTIQQLSFSESGRVFAGWKMYREEDNKWYVKDSTGKNMWLELSNNTLPDGYSYVLYGNGTIVSKSATSGVVHFYAQWNDDGYTVYYHENEGAAASNQTTHVAFGVKEKILSIHRLGYSTNGRIFMGWKVYREDVGAWRVYGEDGNEEWNDKINNDTKFVLYADEAEIEKTAKMGDVHFYAQWIDADLDVTDDLFGANGSDSDDDYLAIQKALSMAKKTEGDLYVRIPAGSYYISDCLVIYSNTHLILSENTNIIRSNPNNSMLTNGSTNETESENEKYNKTKNIVITGGIWDGNAGNGESAINMMFFNHIENLDISNVVMKNCCGNHFIEMAAIKRGSIKDSTFKDFILYKGTDYSLIDEENSGSSEDGITSITSEAIQLDYASESSSPGAIPLDNAPCVEIEISGCIFENCLSGIGNHHSDVVSSAYIIKNNTFTNMKNTCINLYGVTDVQILNNEASGCYKFAKICKCENDIEVNQNIANNRTNEGAGDGLEIVDSKGVNIDNNTISEFKNGLSVNTSNIQIKKNTISKVRKNGILLKDATVIVESNDLKDCYDYNIKASGECKGVIKDNSYDKGYGISISGGEIVREGNNYIYSETEPTAFEVRYHLNDNATESTQKTSIEYDSSKAILKCVELDFNIVGKTFKGWKVYRNDIRKWLVSDADGNIYWSDELPDGGQYALFKDGQVINNTAPVGAEVHLYGQWIGTNSFTVYYHKTDEANASKVTTEVEYGNSTKIKGYEELGFTTAGKRFKGWKVYRTDTKCWRVVNKQGGQYWSKTLPAGDSYYLYGNGVSVSKTAEAGSEVHLYAQWEDTEYFTVYYHSGDGAAASPIKTDVKFGISTKTLTCNELGFSQQGKKFKGWKVYRTDTQSWRVADANGTEYWAKEVPTGGRYVLYSNGCSVTKTVYAGTDVHFYGQWEGSNSFTVYYHKTDTANASKTVTEVEYGKSTKTKSYEELGFTTAGKKFVGWKVYRTDTKCWRVVNNKGVQYWSKTVPEGESYYLYGNGVSVSKTAEAGSEVHLYAQWKDTEYFTVYYHSGDGAAASPTKTDVKFGTSTKTLTSDELGFVQQGKKFKGWKVYRTDTQSWRVADANGTEYWAKEVPTGGRYVLYSNGCSVTKTVYAGTDVHFYGQWEDAKTFTVYYHKTDTANASKTVTEVEYGKSTKTKGYEELGFTTAGKKFVGWKVYRTDTKCWRVVNNKGVQYWSKTVPAGESYYLYGNGVSVAKTTEAGSEVHLYAQWKDTEYFTVYYHSGDGAAASPTKTDVKFGTSTKTLTSDELGFIQQGKKFKGWKVYRTDTQSWRVADANGTEYWAKEVPNGGRYVLYGNGCSVTKTVYAGTDVHFYGQWN